MNDGFSLDDLDGFELPKAEPRLHYTIKLNRDSDFFSMSADELYYGRVVEIEVEKDGKHTFKVIEIVDLYDVKDGFERKLVVCEV